MNLDLRSVPTQASAAQGTDATKHTPGQERVLLVKVKNVYGVMRRADDPQKFFKNILAGSLAKTFGGQAVMVESSYRDTPMDVAPAQEQPLDDELVEAYKAKYGRRPHPAMSPENLRKAVE